MIIRTEYLAEALGVPTEISEEDLEEASEILKKDNFLSNIDEACEVIVIRKILKRIKELTEKVDRL